MRKIGITGGVGSGKSEILRFLRKEYGAEILIADEIGHEQMEPGTPGYAKIRAAFGDGILNAGGEIDRKKLGAVVFADPDKLAVLNGIIHPEVFRVIGERLERAEAKGSPFAVVEAALLLEAGLETGLDEVWYIYVEEETRIRRLMEGRGYSRETCLAIMKNQMGEKAFREACGVTIDNSHTWEETVDAIRKHCEREQR
ncbi:MAG: dephospho-CoA kinase [Lachnospiraceae bacterium]|nr:dephospho-CoA kinase [Lachnospiraceae bacterium]